MCDLIFYIQILFKKILEHCRNFANRIMKLDRNFLKLESRMLESFDVGKLLIPCLSWRKKMKRDLIFYLLLQISKRISKLTNYVINLDRNIKGVPKLTQDLN